jgi:RimJ/RimL family protein N-acetyltransferase/glycosyltransferase involved in cell wall biosynthesis
MYSVLLRPLREEDALTSYKWRNDQEIWKYTAGKPDKYITEKIETEWIKRVLAETDSVRFAILADGKYIGNIQITNILPKNEGEYHIFIGEKDYWNKGVATLASRQLIRYAKEELKLKRLYLFVNPNNKPAIKVYERCGFNRESDEIKMSYDLSEALTPKVSVFVLAYNHESYISKSIDSILCQKTDFDFEVVIGEDCSDDNTRLVIKSISQKNPGKFKLLLHEKNIGAYLNQMTVFSACTGKYIAMCEGDDYWTDPEKLQKETNCLENCNDAGMVCTNYSKYFQINKRLKNNCFNNPLYGKEVRFNDYLLDLSSISTATVMIRNDIVRKYYQEVPEEIRHRFIVGDTPLWLFAAANSRIAVLNEETAVYRILENSACHFKDHEAHYRFVLRGFEMADYFYERYGGGDRELKAKLDIKKNKAALFHAYRTMNSELAKESFRKLICSGAGLKQKARACLMYAGSLNKLLNLLTGHVLHINKQLTAR